jgi:hypothetical protein
MIDSIPYGVGAGAITPETRQPEAIAILLKGRDQVFPLEDVERALTGLKDVRSARIVTNDAGGILEIHVVADTARSAKMVARDVESILVAKIGLSIDHRKISVAQVEEETEETAEAGPTSQAEAKPAKRVEAPAGLYLTPEDKRIEFVGVSLAQSNLVAQVRVELSRDGVGTVAEATGADSTDSVLRIVAEATMEAVQRYFENGGLFTVTAVEQMTVGGKPIVVVVVAHVYERGERVLVGACPTSGDVPRAVALATLDAVNRFLRRLEPKEPTEYEIGPASETDTTNQ